MPGNEMTLNQVLREAERRAAAGQHAQAAELFRGVLAKFPGNRRAAQGLAALGGTAQRQPNPVEGLAGLYRQHQYQQVISTGQDLAKRLPGVSVIPVIMGAAHARLGQNAEAAACFRRALEIEPGNLQARYNLGIVQRELGQTEAAAETFAIVLAAKPDHMDALSALGNLLIRLDRLAEAEEIYRRACEIAPQDVPALIGLGNVLDRLGRPDEAADSYRAALDIQPDHAAAHMNLCEVYEKTNRLDDFAAALDTAEARLPPGDPQVRLRRGQLAFRQKRLEEARDLLSAVDGAALTGVLRQRHANLLGRINDRLGDHGQAFAWFSEMNRIAGEEKGDVDASRYRGEIEALASAWAAAGPVPVAQTKDKGAPAFVIGFPRSGTTLLDTILRGHPNICAIEEGPMVGRMRDVLGTLPVPETLADASDELVAEMRLAYMAELERHPDFAPGRLVIDKLPLNIKDAPLIERVFPRARFVLALRHPCDAVLSCFMQNFALNDAMANFLDLEAAAGLYDAIMRLWVAAEETLSLRVHVLKYEDLVADLPGTVQPLMAFLGLDWHDGMADYQTTALGRGRINTPSYQQVTEPLYSRASGRWLNYRDQMAPVLPLLAPWAERFGYET